MTQSTDIWFRRMHPGPGAGIRIICFPHAGGAASSYLPLSKELSASFDVWAVQYPGRQERRTEPHFDTVDRLVKQICDVIGPLTDRPMAYFGHSMGAIVGFEVARTLERQGAAAPVALFVSGRRAPSTFRDERVHLRDDKGVVAEMKALSGTDARLLDDEEIVQMILPAVRRDYRAIETYSYVPGPELDIPVMAFLGQDDPKATLEEVKAWCGHTNGDFDMHVFPGGHFFLQERLTDVASLVTDRLRTLPG